MQSTRSHKDTKNGEKNTMSEMLYRKTLVLDERSLQAPVADATMTGFMVSVWK
jgi:hypothetical protein